jgi:GalNAc-alpha-(1->4)-GalNAc-alpha-(1->3)-diNAcBac-PP-undecaprenol alpha-1,4-N-acetyl-D-galactosaminyltransferase
MKILFIIPSLHQGGLENHVAVLANSIAKKNYNVSIVCYYNNEIFYDLEERINIIVPLHNRSAHSTLIYYLKSFSFIRKKIKEINPDIIIGFGDNVNFISILACKSINKSIYVGDMSSPGKEFPKLISFFRNVTYPMAKGIIAQTTRAKEQKEQMLGRKVPIQIIPNPLRIVEDIKIEKRNVILGVARHYYVKGIDRLLEAFAKVDAKDWILEIAGSEGPETEKLINQAKVLGIENRVVFLGARKDIDRIYSYSSIFVLPSRSEGLPNALIEAMAHGLPCISFDINAGPSDVIEHKVNGILVEDGNIDELARRMNQLIENKKMRDALGRKAKEIKEKLSIDQITDELLIFIGAKSELKE